MPSKRDKKRTLTVGTLVFIHNSMWQRVYSVVGVSEEGYALHWVSDDGKLAVCPDVRCKGQPGCCVCTSRWPRHDDPNVVPLTKHEIELYRKEGIVSKRLATQGLKALKSI